MKWNLSLIWIAILLFSTAGSFVRGEISAEERSALIALYEATAGDDWTNRANWKNESGDFKEPGTECTWFGVVCSEGETEVLKLQLGLNGLNGTLPPELGQLENLTDLLLFINQITGTIPPELGNLADLEVLWLWSNQLEGPIPAELGELKKLFNLRLERNQLTESIPPELGQATALRILTLSDNRLTGSIPKELAQISSPRAISLDENHLTGSIPPEIGAFSELQFLRLNHNQLTGSIPAELASLSELDTLLLDDNLLTGDVPEQLMQLESLTTLDLSNNQLQAFSQELLDFLDSFYDEGSFQESQFRLFYLPILRNGPDLFTGFAFTNFSEDPALLQLRRFSEDDSGTVLSESSLFALEKLSQRASLGSEIFTFGAEEELTTWVELKSLSGEVNGEPVLTNFDLATFFQFGSKDLSRLDGGIAFDRPIPTLVLPRVFEGESAFRGRSATTVVSLANPTTAPLQIRLTLQDGRDTPLTRTFPMAAREFLSQTLSELFQEPLEVGKGYLLIEVLEGAGAIAFETIQLDVEQTLIGLNGLSPGQESLLFSAQFADNHLLFTEVNLINTSEAPREVNLRALDAEGESEIPVRTETLAPGEQFSRDALELFPDLPSDFVGSLVVEADGGGVLGDVIFGDKQEQRFAAALALQSASFTEAIFNQVANVPGFFTGLAFFHPPLTGAATASLTISVFRADGTLAGERTLQLTPGGRTSQLVDELVEASAGQAGGYIRMTSDQPLVAQMLFGAFDSLGISLFSAVPPTVLK